MCVYIYTRVHVCVYTYIHVYVCISVGSHMSPLVAVPGVYVVLVTREVYSSKV